ncbi:MAG: hypothetical protein RLY16_481, partial [Bacteroidota bacterium]
VQYRKANPVLVYGKYTLVDAKNPDVYAYTREDGNQKLLVVLNFRATVKQAQVPINLEKATLQMTNYSKAPQKNVKGNSIAVRPYEALIYKL